MRKTVTEHYALPAYDGSLWGLRSTRYHFALQREPWKPGGPHELVVVEFQHTKDNIVQRAEPTQLFHAERDAIAAQARTAESEEHRRKVMLRAGFNKHRVLPPKVLHTPGSHWWAVAR